jgi:NAD+ diphosphatase
MNHIERSQRNLFSSATIDRTARTLGDNDKLTALMENDRARFLPIWRDKVLVLKKHGCLKQDGIRKHELASRFNFVTIPVYLGYKDEIHYFAVGVEPESEELRNFIDLRHSAKLLTDHETALLGYALAMLTWHRHYKYCGLCGSLTHAWQGGHVLKCTNPECMREHYPRTDPAIIVLVQHQDRALFGRKAEWPAFRYSTIAGFIEPGESAEQAVVREVSEETGVQVTASSYHSSQPWPFSTSLMFGYMAQAGRPTNIQLHDNELEDAQWLSRKEIVDRLLASSFLPPASISISFRLIEDWFDQDSAIPFRVLCENNTTSA